MLRYKQRFLLLFAPVLTVIHQLAKVYCNVLLLCDSHLRGDKHAPNANKWMCAETHSDHGSLKGTPEDVMAYKVWDVLNGLGGMAFAYSFSFILLEISVGVPRPCLPSPPRPCWVPAGLGSICPAPQTP